MRGFFPFDKLRVRMTTETCNDKDGDKSNSDDKCNSNDKSSSNDLSESFAAGDAVRL